MIREKIEATIKEHGLSQREVAMACGIEYRNFNSFLRGRRNLPYKDLERVLSHLKMILV